MSTLPTDGPQNPLAVTGDNRGDMRNAHAAREHRPDQPPQREGQPLKKIAATQDAAREASGQD